ncbi:hypothetical protein AABM17_1301 [Neisseria musculi]|uniref:Uncharacterized protein n=2 Tax=Neisseria musculi TaxID=1815583 RepID=A0A7H1M8Y3_9NEIS|nr:hypothetical protein H7A79_1301 [Neisseria musculi]
MFAPMWQILDEAERSGQFYLPLDFTVPMMEGMAETAIQHLAAPSSPGQQAAFEMMWRALVKP